jgi:transposase
MKTLKITDFTGQNIFIGLDVHKKSWTVTILFNGMEHKTFSQPPQPEALIKYLEKNFPNGTYHCVYEAGFSGFWIQRKLKALGANCIIVHPADVPTSDRDKKRKTDKVDSRKLARNLYNQELEGIFIPDTAQEEARNLIRGRAYIVKDLTRVKNRIKQTISRYGIFPPDAKEDWTKAYLRWLHSIQLETAAGTAQLKANLNYLEEIKRSLKGIERSIIELSKEEKYKATVEYLRTIPGIGMVTAMTLVTEIGDIHRFPSLDDLCSFVGLVPNTNSSGDNERIGRMTKRGNSHLRHVIIESAWKAMKLDPALALAYKNYTIRMKANKAIIRIARKLLARVRFVMINQTHYQLLVA